MSVLARHRRRGIDTLPPSVAAFILLPFLLEAAIVFAPAIQGILLSFTEWRGVGSPKAVGLENFRELSDDPIFAVAFKNTVRWLLLFGGLSGLLGLSLALLLKVDRRGVSIYRSLIFLPVIFSLVVTALVWRVLYAPEGLFNNALEGVGLESSTRIWLADERTVLYALVLASLWRSAGYIMVLYLAGLKSIDPTLMEAARVDGASRWQLFQHITIPQLKGVNSVVLSVIVIDALRSFDIVYALTKGGPYNSSQLLSTYMFQTAFATGRLGYASAIAMVIFMLSITFIVVYLVRALREDPK
jgi:multiple sugar transport system permease protein